MNQVLKTKKIISLIKREKMFLCFERLTS